MEEIKYFCLYLVFRCVRLIDITYPLLYITQILFRITELKKTSERFFCITKVLVNITNFIYKF